MRASECGRPIQVGTSPDARNGAVPHGDRWSWRSNPLCVSLCSLAQPRLSLAPNHGHTRSFPGGGVIQGCFRGICGLSTSGCWVCLLPVCCSPAATPGTSTSQPMPAAARTTSASAPLSLDLVDCSSTALETAFLNCAMNEAKGCARGPICQLQQPPRSMGGAFSVAP